MFSVSAMIRSTVVNAVLLRERWQSGVAYNPLWALVSKAFTPRAVKALEPRIRSILGTLLDDIDNPAAFDLMQAVPRPLPVIDPALRVGLRIGSAKIPEVHDSTDSLGFWQGQTPAGRDFRRARQRGLWPGRSPRYRNPCNARQRSALPSPPAILQLPQPASRQN